MGRYLFLFRRKKRNGTLNNFYAAKPFTALLLVTQCKQDIVAKNKGSK
jgi:hypothetical protein